MRQRVRLAPLYLAMIVADGVGNCLGPSKRRRRRAPWRAGLTVIIPDRDAPSMLSDALASLSIALAKIDEPHQIIVVANGAPRDVYSDVAVRFPMVEFSFSDAPLGFAEAIEVGLAGARFDGTFLMNNDMVLDASAIAELLALREPDVFAVGSQIFQQDASGRREETGFTDWYADRGGVRVFHADVRVDFGTRPHLFAGGGAALFRTQILQSYLPASRCYDPFYWEDAEWGVRAWRDGLRVLFCPQSHAAHRHRATTARFYSTEEIDRIVERNRLLFDARHRVTANGRSWLMDRICELPYASQRDLACLSRASGVFRYRIHARRGSLGSPVPTIACPPGGTVTLQPSSYSYRLRQSITSSKARPRLLVVTPFAIFPPRHGGARRITELLAGMRERFDIVLVSDEASSYDARSFAYFDGLCAVQLVQRNALSAAHDDSSLQQRIRSHCHPALVEAVDEVIRRYRPEIVQIEYAELAELVVGRRPGARWVLNLHDAYGRADFSTHAAAERYRATLDAYDAITVCSEEDLRLVTHRRVVRIPNGSRLAPQSYVPSTSMQVLFVGPFRYAPNREGIRRFLRESWPVVHAAVPNAMLVVLGGDEHRDFSAGDAAFAQPGVALLGHRDDVQALIASSALTINPLSGIRGSAVKLIESLAAGRVCVSTHEGARGFADSELTALVTVPDVADMAAPVIELLTQPELRHRIEVPSATLTQYGWERSIEMQKALHDSLLDADPR